MSDSFIFVFGIIVYSLAIAPLIYVLISEVRSDE
jgi:hypothetical protein